MEALPAPGEATSLALVPIGPLEEGWAESLVERLSRQTSIPWHLRPALASGEFAFLPRREQVDADVLLERLESEAAGGTVLVGLTRRDLGIPLFTFVLGRARRGGRAALVSLARLDPRFYGLDADPRLLATRAVVEVLHELGHVAGLAHCGDASCLMSFANSVARVDVRGMRFCPGCEARLPRWMRR